MIDQNLVKFFTVADGFSVSRLIMLIPITYLGLVHAENYEQGEVFSVSRIWMINDVFAVFALM